MKKALIVYGGWEGHAPEPMARLIAAELKEIQFEVELSNSLDSFLDEARLKTFALIVPIWTMGRLTPGQSGALYGAIASGVGLGGFHGGMGDAFRDDLSYQFMTGGQAVAHPDNLRDYTVNLIKKSDPIVSDLNDFSIHSEQCYMHVDPANRGVGDHHLSNGKHALDQWNGHAGRMETKAWKRACFLFCDRTYRRGFRYPPVREILIRGLSWAARAADLGSN